MIKSKKEKIIDDLSRHSLPVTDSVNHFIPKLEAGSCDCLNWSTEVVMNGNTHDFGCLKMQSGLCSRDNRALMSSQ